MSITDAREQAEKTLGFSVPESVAKQVLDYSARKCEANGKGAGYLPILYENELRDYYMRLEINMMGGLNDVRHLPPMAV